MALVLKKLYQGYFWVFDELSDKRTDDILIFKSPLCMLAIQASYIYIVKYLGPKLMENRKPFNIKKILLVYNTLQIFLNAFICYKACNIMAPNLFGCGKINYSTDEQGLSELSISLQFLSLKILDLMDTVFFVLRKSYRQVNFLHVYHHVAMILCLWIGARFFPGGVGMWLVIVNGFVHVLMFTYYLLTALDSSWKNSIRLKKALTQIQLIQFTIFIIIFGRTLVDPSCEYPKLPGYLLVPQNCFMLFLFGDFYVKEYIFKKEKNN
ncbi:very long chain fatty acid elongase 7 [Leptinotarsa decemlineata]|uniref:very long chain fatty acid elongase 7 n=1 Tax=Leptinotarsa decemlineata TaxID=7539 RepID=UPI003D30B889